MSDGATKEPQPIEISALTSLRGVALTVLLFHIMQEFRGYLGVDLFFLLGGFVLTHVYGEMSLTRQSFLAFLKARLARIYAIHLTMLVLLLPMLNYSPEFSAGGLVSSLLLLQSPWHTMCWNFFSWSISAEWHAYLLFPLLVMNYRTRSNRVLIATLIVCASLVGWNDYHNGTGNIPNGVVVFLRFLPEFIGGIVLYLLYQRGCVPKWIGCDMTFWISIAMLPPLEWVQAPDGMMICVLGMALVTSAANRGHPTRVLNCFILTYLGRISYSLYMVQWVIAIFLIISLDLLASSMLYKILYVVLCFLSAAIISPTIEYPARNWLKRISWRSPLRHPLTGLSARG